MTIQTDISTALQSVVTTFGLAWTYKALTSAYDAEARTYAAGVAVTAQKVGDTMVEEYDDKRSAWVRRVRAELKLTDVRTVAIGDQFVDTNSHVWHVDGTRDAADIDGIYRVQISRDIGLKGGADRGGGA